MADNKQHCSSGGHQDGILSVSSSSRPDFLSIFNRESHYPIFRTFCECLSIAEIVALTRTCKSLSGLYRYLLPLLWDVDKALRRYFDDPLGFRSQMAKCDALLHGKFAAQYFERVIWDSELLEIAVAEGSGSELLRNYLSEVAGYTNVDKYVYGNRPGSFVETRIFKRNGDSKTAIHLRSTSYPPIENIIYNTRTTVGVSIMSWNRAYSLFALPTSIQRKSYLLHPRDERTTKEEARHDSEKGWHVQSVTFPEEERRNHPVRQRRHIGDRYTWTIPFDTRKVKGSTTPDYVLEHAYFKIYLPGGLGRRHYDEESESERHCYPLRMRGLESSVLKHTYFYCEGNMRVFLQDRLYSLTNSQLRKLDPAQRPTNYDEVLSHCYYHNFDKALERFKPPASWTYYDDQIPAWYKEFEKRYPEPI